jgi:uncharacterized membrane protein
MSAMYDWLLFLHIVFAMVWLGSAVLLCAQALIALGSPETEAPARFMAALQTFGPRVLAPASVGTLGFGVWLVLNSPAWGFGQLWVLLALGLVVAAVLAGAAHQARMALAAQAAAERGDNVEVRRRLVSWSWGYLAIAVLLLATAWDMVFKPGL